MAAWASSCSFINNERKERAQLKSPTPFFLAEGLFMMSQKRLRDLCDLKLFVDAPEVVRVARWKKRAASRAADEDSDGGKALLHRTLAMHNRHVEPSQSHAHIVINGAAPLQCIDARMKQLTKLLLTTFYPHPIPALQLGKRRQQT